MRERESLYYTKELLETNKLCLSTFVSIETTLQLASRDAYEMSNVKYFLLHYESLGIVGTQMYLGRNKRCKFEGPVGVFLSRKVMTHYDMMLEYIYIYIHLIYLIHICLIYLYIHICIPHTGVSVRRWRCGCADCYTTASHIGRTGCSGTNPTVKPDKSRNSC